MTVPPTRRRRLRTWAPSLDGEGLRSVIGTEAETKAGPALMDLASNDYLGLSHHPQLIAAAEAELQRSGVGAGGSRLVTGSRPVHDRLETALAQWLQRDRVFLFPSGFQANLAAVLALANRHTTVLADRLIHHSLLVGVQASGAQLKRFAHNDLHALHHQLQACRSQRPDARLVVISESLFSMEGTSPDVPALAALCRDYGARLLLDEAHALGVLGFEGRGLGLGLEGITMISGTFGKAFGSGGAFLACDREQADALLQTSGAFRYTTALAPPLAAAALAALDLLKGHPCWGSDLVKKSNHWRNRLEAQGWSRPAGIGPILPLLVGGDQPTLEYQQRLEAAGVLTVAIRPPTVPEGTARLRLVLHHRQSDEALDALVNTLGHGDLRS